MKPLVFEHRKARAAYEVLESFEAGIVLTGAEVKSLRLGKVNFTGSYVSFIEGRPFVLELSVGRYPKAADLEYEPKRPRALLLRKKEIERLYGLTQQKGVTLVPLRVYFKNNRIKVEVGVVRGKKKHDRREELKRRDIQREIEIAVRGKV